MIATFALVTALGATLPTAYKGPCPTSRARYELRGDPKISMGLRRYPSGAEGTVSDVYMFVHSARSGKTYWFEFDWGSARIINVYPIENPDGRTKSSPTSANKAPPYDNMTFWAADGGLNFTVVGPEAKRIAPKYVLIPELENTMWYGAEPREAVPTAFFILKECAKP